MYGNQFANNGSGIRAVVWAIMLLVVAVFFIGALALGSLQWIQPQIGDAIAKLKNEEARTVQLQNDSLAADIHAKEIANQKQDQIAQLDVEKQKQQNAQEIQSAKQWDQHWQEWIGLLVNALSPLLFWGPFLLLAAVLARWLNLPQLLVQGWQGFAVRQAIPVPISVTANPANSLDESKIGVIHEQTASEKELHRAERERARQREREARAFTQRRVA